MGKRRKEDESKVTRQEPPGNKAKQEYAALIEAAQWMEWMTQSEPSQGLRGLGRCLPDIQRHCGWGSKVRCPEAEGVGKESGKRTCKLQ